jgi:hypothetical protein
MKGLEFFRHLMVGNSGIPVWMLAVIGRHGRRKGGIFFPHRVAFAVTLWVRAFPLL